MCWFGKVEKHAHLQLIDARAIGTVGRHRTLVHGAVIVKAIGRAVFAEQLGRLGGVGGVGVELCTNKKTHEC